MSDNVLFEAGDVEVTTSQLVHGGNHYPLQSIKSVTFFKQPLDIKGLLINALGALAGLYGVSRFSIFWVIVGLIALGICGANLYSDYTEIKNPTFIVAVSFHSGESIYIKRRDFAWAKKLDEALHAALRG